QPGRLVGVGVSTMGITFEDRIELAPNVQGWSRLRLPEMLRGQYPGVNIRIDNDVKAAAFAELTWGALQGADPGIYVNLGSGIAATIIAGGKVFAGAHGAAGEYGYWLRAPMDSVAEADERVAVGGLGWRAGGRGGLWGGTGGWAVGGGIRRRRRGTPTGRGRGYRQWIRRTAAARRRGIPRHARRNPRGHLLARDESGHSRGRGED